MSERNLWRGDGIQEVAGKPETNITKLEHFVNVHQITFKETQDESEDQLSYFSFLKDFIKWSPADGTVRGVHLSCL